MKIRFAIQAVDRVRGVGEQASPEKGLGLGLSFVAWIVRAHGGTIDVQSEPRKGTTFRVSLPLVSSEPVRPEGVAVQGESLNPA